jgi:hypothetical protein
MVKRIIYISKRFRGIKSASIPLVEILAML